MTHEFGHALGFPNSNGWLSNVDDRVTPAFFTGTNAVREYNSVFGTAANPNGVPIEQDGGAGTAYAHWDDAIFGNELMTGFINVGLNPLSVITVGAFDDMGYTVDYAAADPYTPPAANARSGLNQPVGAAASRALPARISFPDRPALILEDNNATRELVRAALHHAAQKNSPTGPLDLRHLADEQRAVLAAWASAGREAVSVAAGWSPLGPEINGAANWAGMAKTGSGSLPPRLFALVGMG